MYSLKDYSNYCNFQAYHQLWLKNQVIQKNKKQLKDKTEDEKDDGKLLSKKIVSHSTKGGKKEEYKKKMKKMETKVEKVEIVMDMEEEEEELKK